MRFIGFALLALVACTETEQERLDSLIAETTVNCGSSQDLCFVNAEQVAACMNDALASGARAQLRSDEKDSKYWDVDRYWLTIDHQLVVFESHPDGDAFDEDAYASETQRCTGTVRVEGPCITTINGYRGHKVSISGCQ